MCYLTMKLVQFPASAIRLGVQIPFSLRDKSGQLLLVRGSVVAKEEDRQLLIARGVYVDEEESEPLQRALVSKLGEMVRANALIGEIAKATMDGTDSYSTPRKPHRPEEAWPGLVLRTSRLLGDVPTSNFSSRLLELQNDVFKQIDRHADISLLVLVQSNISDTRDYSAKHSLFVTVVCELAARKLTHWPEDWRLSLRCAAISMNVAMTALQDQLATQHFPPNPKQRQQIETHAARGVEVLKDCGVSDQLWLDAVALHHNSTSGPLTSLPPGAQLARLLRRADIFTARLSPRSGRKALSASSAAKAAYFDESDQADDVGAAIVKAIGLYPPGSYVRLGNGEVAMVLRRGHRANEPKVVSVIGRQGVPLLSPVVRDTRSVLFNVIESVLPSEVNVRINLESVTNLV